MCRSTSSILLTALVACAIGPVAAHAEELDLDLLADGNGRWHEVFSDAFAQVDGGPSYPGNPGFDGAYQWSRLPNFVTLGGGMRAFPFGANWEDAGQIEADLSGITGRGIEMAPITGLTIDFDTFIADDDAITSEGYSTELSEISGQLTFDDGEVVSIDLDSNVRFGYDASAFNLPIYYFDGTFTIEANEFDLRVEGTRYEIDLGTVGYEWFFTGGATVTSLPEPGAPGIAALFALGVLASAKRRQRPGVAHEVNARRSR